MNNSASTCLTLKEIVNELREVTDWHKLGVQLEVPSAKLKEIEKNYTTDTIRCKTEVLDWWLRNQPEISWKKLAQAVEKMGGYASLAQNLRMKISATSKDTSADRKQNRAAMFAHDNQATITAKFADFQMKVCGKLVKNGVDIELFGLYVRNLFPPGDFVPPPPASIIEIFSAITRHGLWDHLHYSPLMQIAEAFGASDAEIVSWVETYKKDLKAYSMVANVEDYIEEDLDIAGPSSAKKPRYDHDVADPPQIEYDPRYNTPVEWKTEFYDHSLQYLTKVWKLFSCRFLIPSSPPTALLNRVRKGCLSVTWLIPSGLIPTLVETAGIHTDFFRKYRILKVTIGNQCVYEEVPEEVGELGKEEPTDTQMQQIKNELEAKLERVILRYFKQRNQHVRVTDLKSFVNTTIHYECMKLKDNYLPVRISAEVDDAIEVIPVETGSVAAVAGIGVGIGCAIGCLGGPIGMAAGIVIGGLVGSVVYFSKAKELKCTAEEIFPLLAADKFEKRGGLVECTVRLPYRKL